jgi:hypothetical protein
LKICLKIKFEDPQGLANVCGGRSNRYKRQHNIALFDMVLNPFPVDADITLNKMESSLPPASVQFVAPDVHPVNLPIRVSQDSFGKTVPYKPVYTKNQYSHIGLPPFVLQRSNILTESAIVTAVEENLPLDGVAVMIRNVRHFMTDKVVGKLPQYY